MQFITPVHIPAAPFRIHHQQQLLSMGSCFSEHIGQRLKAAFFQIEVNPYGVLFNPASIAQSLHRILTGIPYTADELVEHNGLWHSMAHHGDFSNPCKETALKGINSQLAQAHQALLRTDVLLLTFGTAWVYELNGSVAANCHKLPADRFVRRRMRTEEITALYTALLQQLQARHPELRIIFTVSPVRHLKDGLHDNQLSKATLLLAVDEICREMKGVASYFPAYEIVTDELRDYRFFAEDMTHPTEQAAQYVWERFRTTYFDKETQQFVAEAERIQRDLNHRPLHPESKDAIAFKEAVQARAEAFKHKLYHQG